MIVPHSTCSAPPPGPPTAGKGSSPTFLAAESDADTTVRQWDRFQEVLQSLPRRPALVHAANSAAALRGRGFAADLVRPGIFLYGGTAGKPEPRPVAALRTRVVAVRTIGAGDTVGYGAAWRANTPRPDRYLGCWIRRRIAPLRSGGHSIAPGDRAERQAGPGCGPCHHGPVHGRGRARCGGRGCRHRLWRACVPRPAGGGGRNHLLRASHPAGLASGSALREVSLNPHFASLVLGLAQQAEPPWADTCPKEPKGWETRARWLRP